jgi:apolipoprotein N-acyltransferase
MGAWCMPLSYIMLYHEAIHNRLRFKHGFYWGFIIYSTHALPIILFSTTLAHRDSMTSFMRFGVWAAVVIYSAIQAGIWFAIAHYISSLRSSVLYKITMWCLLTVIFIYWMDRFFLWPCGIIEGYRCFHPLLALARVMPFIVRVQSIWLYTIGFVFLCGISAYIGHYAGAYGRSIKLCVVSIMSYIILAHNTFTHDYRLVERPLWLNTLVYIVPQWSFEPLDTAWDRAHILYKQIRQKVFAAPDCKLIIFPESAFPFALNTYPEIVSYWYTAIPRERRDQIVIILGAHRICGKRVFNSCYMLKSGSIQHVYDKQHGLLWVERIPEWSHAVGLGDIMTKHAFLFSQSEGLRSPFAAHTVRFDPLICSDNFFNTGADLSPAQGHTRLCLVNDAWCKHTFLPDLLYNTIYLYARLNRYQVLYISHTRGQLITHDGSEFMV